jgi:hypothetical protein
MKLITEHSEDLQCIVEANSKGEKKFTIEGVFMQAEQVNRNKRLYPKRVLSNAISEYDRNYISKGRAVGELNHPDGPAINLDKVSHRITELVWNGNDVFGKALILNTPMGLIVKGLLEGGCQLGVSSRGIGTVETRNGQTVVNNDFKLATVDIVQDPSAPSAFVNGIMEGTEYFYKGNNIVAVASDHKRKQISKLSTREIAEQQESLFKSFLSDISAKI